MIALSLIAACCPSVFADAPTSGSIRRSLDANVVTEEPSTNYTNYMYHDKVMYSHCAYRTSYAGSSTYIGSGTSSARISYLNKNGDSIDLNYIYWSTVNTVAALHTMDYDNTALCFMYNPVYAREETYVGLTERTSKGASADSGCAALMISLKDYIGLTSADFSKNEWINVTIPVNYFFEHGTFDPLRGTETEFKRHTINGVIFAYSKEGLPATQSSSLPIAYVDEVHFATIVPAPVNLKYSTSSGNITVSWGNAGENPVDKYIIYRGGEYLATLNQKTSYTDNNVTDGENYVYSVCSVDENNVHSPVSNIEVTAGAPGISSFTENAELTATVDSAAFSQGEAALIFGGSDNAEGFVINKNGVPIGKSTSGYFTDTTYTDGDSYTVNAVKFSTGEKSAPAVPNSSTPEPQVQVQRRQAFAMSTTVTDPDIPVVKYWNRHSSATSWYSTYLGASLAYFAIGNSQFHQRQAAQPAVSLPDTDRYRILPLTTLNGTTLGGEPTWGKTFAANVDDFGSAYITIDAAKGSGYNTTNIKGLKIGLAYIDKNTTTSYTTSGGATQTVYATGIKWYDVTSEFAALPAWNSTNAWNDVKRTISVSVSDIINNGTTKYLHGASASTHAVTLANANAIAVDMVAKDGTTVSSSPVILFENISIEKRTLVEPEVTGDINVGELAVNIQATDVNQNIYSNGGVTLNSVPDRIKVSTINTTASAKTAKLLCVMYDGDKLDRYKEFNISLPLGSSEFVLYPGFYNSLPGEYKMKVMLLDNLDNIKPMAKASTSEFTMQQQAASTVTVGNTDYQTITGWGISPFYISNQLGSYGRTPRDFCTFSEYEEWPEMYDKIYGELGITSVRVPIDKDFGEQGEETSPGSGIYKGTPISEQMDYVAKYIERAKDFGIDDWILCFWSPPAHMIEKNWVDYREAELYNIKTEYRDAYCEYIIDILDDMRDRGLGTPSGLSFQNEPENGSKYPRYEVDDYKYIAKKLRSLLDSNGYTSVLIQGPETSAYNNCYRISGGSYGNINFSYLQADQDYANAIGIICAHTYTNGSSTNADVAKFADARNIFPDKELWMTEVSTIGSATERTTVDKNGQPYDDLTMGPALATMRILSADVGWGGMNRWYYWRAYVTHYNPDDNGASYDVLNDKYSQQSVVYGQIGGKVVESKLYKCLKILFNNVPVGSTVRRLTSNDSGFTNYSALKTDLLAFDTENGTVVMAINITSSPKTVNFAGLTGTTANVYSVTGNDDDILTYSYDISNGTAGSVHIPARSVTVIACE